MSLSVPVPPVAAVAVVFVAVVVLVAVVAAVAVVVAVVWDLLTGLEAGSTKAETRVSLSERPGTVPESDSVVDRRRPTSMGTGKNEAMDTRSLDETGCCSAATLPAERVGDTAATVLMPLSLEVRDV